MSKHTEEIVTKCLEVLCRAKIKGELHVKDDARFDQKIEVCKILAGAIKAKKIKSKELEVEILKAIEFSVTNLLAESVKAKNIETDKLKAFHAEIQELIVNKVSAQTINTGYIHSDKVTAGTVEADKIVAGTVEADTVTADTVNAKTVDADAITTDSLDSKTVCFDPSAAPPTDNFCLYVLGNILRFIRNGIEFSVNLTPLSPFHGFWVADTRGPSRQNGNVNYTAISIDASQIPIRLTPIVGPLNQLRQPVPPGFIFSDSGPVLNYFPTDDVNAIAANVVGNRRTLTLQPDGNTLISYSQFTGDTSSGGLSLTVYRKASQPFIRPFGPGEQIGPDVNNRVNIFNEFCDMLIQQMTTINASINYDYYPGYSKTKEHQQKLLTTGVSYTSNVVRVQKSLNPPLLPGTSTILTTIELKNSANISRACSKVTFAGFGGALGPLLNGKTFITQFSQNVTYSTSPEENGYSNLDHNNFSFTIPLDTSGLAADGEGFITSDLGTVTNVVDPVTAGCDYQTLISAQFEMFHFTLKFSTHSFVQFFVPAPGTGNEQQIFQTFEQIAAALPSLSIVFTFGQMRVPYPKGSFIQCNNFVRTFGPVLAQGSPFIDLGPPINNPFRFLPQFGNKWDYFVPQNYLLANTVRNLYWTLTGAATNTLQSIAGQLYLGNPAIGRTFIGALAPFGQTPNNTQVWWLPGADAPGFDKYQAETFICGLWDPQYSQGKRIGYVRIGDSFGLDPNLFMVNGVFSLDNSVYKNIDPALAVWSVLFKYLFTDLQVEAVLLDITANLGGTAVFPFIINNFFGADRQGYRDLFFPIDQGFGSPYTASGFNVSNNAFNIAETNVTQTIRTSLVEARYPGSVFKNGKLTVLTDLVAFSSGDIIPWGFLGDAGDKNIGGGVTCKIQGEISGRLLGGTGSEYLPMRTRSGYLLQFNNEPIPAYTTGFENPGIGLLEYLANGLPVNLVPGLKIDDDLTGTFPPGPWNDDFANTVYPDYGLVPAIYPRMPGDLRPQPDSNPNDQSLFRHIWLEVAVRNLLI